METTQVAVVWRAVYTHAVWQTVPMFQKSAYETKDSLVARGSC